MLNETNQYLGVATKQLRTYGFVWYLQKHEKTNVVTTWSMKNWIVRA